MLEMAKHKSLKDTAKTVVIASVLAGLGFLEMTAAMAAEKSSTKTEAAVDVGALKSLNGTWQFALGTGEADLRRLENFYKPDFDVAGFKPTPVPSNWVMQGYDKPQYKSWKGEASEGFYLRRFDAPASWKDQRVMLHFGGVWASAEVWLNGRALGRQDVGFNKISYEISSAIKPGSENVLAVRVRQVVPNYELDTNDDWALGGIYRDVTLETMPNLTWLDRVEIRTEFDQYYRDAELKVRVIVGDHHKRKLSTIIMNQGDPYMVRLTLLDSAGKVVQTQDTTLPPHDGSGGDTTLAMHVQKPLQWNAETPNLYKLNVELVQEGKVTHRREVNVGFREISTKGGVLRVNGQAVKLRGTNRHDEHPETGRATTLAQWAEDLALMKAGNINYLRLAHYPPAEGFLDLCDKVGMYVSDEIPFGFGGDGLENHPEMVAAILQRTYLTVASDINHPSIIIWSVGNEDPLTTLNMAAVRVLKGLDDSRPVLIPLRADRNLPKEIDILAPHYWSARMYDDEAGRSERPMVTTEFTHAYGVEGFGGFKDRWTALTRHPAGAGGAMWLWADQGLMVRKAKPDGTEERVLDVPEAGFDGIVDALRKPTRDYWEAKAVYAQVYPTAEKLSFVPGQSTLRLGIQNDFDFSNLSGVKIKWQLMEDDKELKSGTTSISGVPHAASWLELPIDSLKKTKPGAAYYLWLTFLRADGSEISKRSVELLSAIATEAAGIQVVPKLIEKDGVQTIEVGDSSFQFNSKTGLLSSASYKGVARIADLRPTIWRTLNSTERLKLSGKYPDLNKYTAAASKWKVVEADGHVSIHADVAYTVDDNNSFKVAYDYDVSPIGALTVRYSIVPSVQAKWLPQVGLELQTPSGYDALRWLGLGPLDAYPNMNTAAALGVYFEKLGVAGADGMKAIRWADITNASGSGIRVRSQGYVNYVGTEPGRVRILSSIVGRQTKADRPEEPYGLEVGTAPHVGALTIELHQ